jgi:hypothetical protein
MSKDIEKYDPIFNISEADKAVAKYLTPWTPSGLLNYNLFIYYIIAQRARTHRACWRRAGDRLGGRATRAMVAVHACVLAGPECAWASARKVSVRAQSVCARLSSWQHHKYRHIFFYLGAGTFYLI